MNLSWPFNLWVHHGNIRGWQQRVLTWGGGEGMEEPPVGPIFPLGLWLSPLGRGGQVVAGVGGPQTALNSPSEHARRLSTWPWTARSQNLVMTWSAVTRAKHGA
jgi:hypothetical protein